MRDELVEVTQVDREAAARFVIDCNAGGLAAGHHEAYRRGEGDASVLVRILARHRIEAVAAAEPAIRADEREKAAALIERRNPNEGGRLDALAIRRGKGEGAWQPIDVAPKDGTKAILYFPQHAHDGFDGVDYRYRLAIYRNGEWRDQGTNHYSFEGSDLTGDDKATHWQPFPEPPAIRAGQGERG